MRWKQSRWIPNPGGGKHSANSPMPPGSIASGFTATIGLCSAEPATPAVPAKPPATEKALAELDQAIGDVYFDDATVADALMFLSLRTEKKFSVVCSPKSLEEERLPTIRLKNRQPPYHPMTAPPNTSLKKQIPSS